MLRDFKVTLEVPQGATVSDVKEYIDRVVRCECGSLSTYDPMFNLNRKTIVVKQILKHQPRKSVVIYSNDPNAPDDDIWVTLFNCPNCECSIHEGSKFCSHCGVKIKWKINKEWKLNAIDKFEKQILQKFEGPIGYCTKCNTPTHLPEIRTVDSNKFFCAICDTNTIKRLR